MGITIIPDPASLGTSGTPPLVADRLLLTDASKQLLLEEGDAAAAYVVAGPGTQILPEWVKALELVAGKDGVVVQVSKAKAEPKERKAGGDKQRKSGASKAKAEPAGDAAGD